MDNHDILGTLKYLIIGIVPFVEPQIAGILGAITYVMARHELKLPALRIKSVFIALFFGWMAGWVTVELIEEYWKTCPHVWEHIISAILGFLSYDTMLMFCANTKSVLGFVVGIAKTLIESKVKKWKS